MTLSAGARSVRTILLAPSVPAAWARYFAPAIRGWGRDIAIKILPDSFARDPSRVARFDREARLLASLNHANIAAIYGLEQSDGVTGLVLEFVEGETAVRSHPRPRRRAVEGGRAEQEPQNSRHANFQTAPDGQYFLISSDRRQGLREFLTTIRLTIG